jgi:Flp pilus assembly protein TadG
MNRRPDPRPLGARWRHPVRRGPGRDESGQALVEFALVLPLLVLLVGIAFNGWDAMQVSIRLTSAARAGAIAAANALSLDEPTNSVKQAAIDAINQEEGGGSTFQGDSSQPNSVSVVTNTSESLNDDGNGDTGTIGTVTVTITPSSITLIPFVQQISVATHATARYS